MKILRAKNRELEIKEALYLLYYRRKKRHLLTMQWLSSIKLIDSPDQLNTPFHQIN